MAFKKHNNFGLVGVLGSLILANGLLSYVATQVWNMM